MIGESEQEWANLQPFLHSQGYLLRRRFHPNWKPPQKPKLSDETSVPLTTINVIDAIRVSDRNPVVLKRVESRGKEVVVHQRILKFTNSRRYITPIYDTILLPDTDETYIVILPLLRPLYSPYFTNVYEALACTLQLVEGLAQLHADHCVHRDVSTYNIHMHAPGMYPKGWHFMSTDKYHPGHPPTSKSPLKWAPYLPRTLTPPQYLFTDFELSLVLDPEESHFQIGARGTHIAPEMGGESISNPYAVDVWALGSVIKNLLRGPGHDRSYYEEIRSILVPLAETMMTENPKKRPTAQQALKELREIIRSVAEGQLRKTLYPKQDWSYFEIMCGLKAILQGQGDERILFAQLRGVEPPKSKTFAQVSIQEKMERTGRALRFLLHVGEEGNALEWLAPKQSSK